MILYKAREISNCRGSVADRSHGRTDQGFSREIQSTAVFFFINYLFTR